MDAGMMSDVDILDAISKHEIVITPFDAYNDVSNRLTPAGFNFSFSRFIVSLNKRAFCRIYEEVCSDIEKREKYNELCIYLNPGDTAIALTNESIWVSSGISGTFHSKVSYVSQGLGHVSTTLDPRWQGQLLISVNNPNSKRKRIIIGKKYKDNGIIIYNTFITLCLFRLITKTEKFSDNTSARMDTLFDILENNNRNRKNANMAKLISKVSEMRQFLTAQRENNPGLKNLDVVTNEDVRKFVDDHRDLLQKLDSSYNQINEINERNRRTKKITLYVGTAGFLLIITALVWFLSFQKDQVRWFTTTIVAIIGALGLRELVPQIYKLNTKG